MNKTGKTIKSGSIVIDKRKVPKQERRDKMFNARESSNNIKKRKKVMRKLKIDSKGDYLVHATDKLYIDLNLAPLNSNAEEMEQ